MLGAEVLAMMPEQWLSCSENPQMAHVAHLFAFRHEPDRWYGRAVADWMLQRKLFFRGFRSMVIKSGDLLVHTLETPEYRCQDVLARLDRDNPFTARNPRKLEQLSPVEFAFTWAFEGVVDPRFHSGLRRSLAKHPEYVGIYQVADHPLQRYLFSEALVPTISFDSKHCLTNGTIPVEELTALGVRGARYAEDCDELVAASKGVHSCWLT
jgi:hypothetical protein